MIITFHGFFKVKKHLLLRIDKENFSMKNFNLEKWSFFAKFI